MQIIVDLHIICEAPGSKGYVYGSVGKVYETDLVPMVGMELEDPAWKDPRPIKNVTMNPEEGYYYIFIGDDTGHNEAHCQQLQEMYHSHGWTRMLRHSSR